MKRSVGRPKESDFAAVLTSSATDEDADGAGVGDESNETLIPTGLREEVFCVAKRGKTRNTRWLF